MRLPALKLARDLIAQARETYICLALEAVAKAQPRMALDCAELRREIQRDLARHSSESLDGYIMCRYHHSLTSRQAWLCRLAWLDKMIEDEK